MRIRLNHKRLLELIAESKLSQNHWAMRLGLSKGHWSGIVNGKHPYPSKATQDRLLEAFGVMFEELFIHESHSGIEAEFQAALADRYLIERVIGRGGMGTVHLARDVKLGRTVAIKVVSPEAVSGIGTEQFLKEIRYTARLQHHNILPVYDAGEAAGAPYYVMPYIRSGSLGQLLERERILPIERALKIAGGIADALEYAHDRQVLHCDVKPGNVLMSGNHAFVADFGLARAIHTEAFEWGYRTELDSSAGTPAYVSPEQATGERNLDSRSDVYSLGCLVFEMLAGRAPFAGGSTVEIVAKRFMTLPDLRRHAPHVPPAVASVVARAMETDPAERPDSAVLLAEELARAAGQRRSRVLERASLPAIRLISTTSRGLSTRFPKLSTVLEEVSGDLQYAFRTLRKAPVFTLIAMLTVALGIAVNAAVFTVVNGVLFRPLPYERADELVMIWTFRTETAEPDTFTVSPADFVDWRDQAASFSDMAAFNINLASVTGETGTEQVHAGIVTPNFFDLIGVHPILGTGFDPTTDENSQPTVVLSYGFWQRWFGADPSVLDSTLSVDGTSYLVVGVMPSDYRHPDPSREFSDAEFWRPWPFDPEAPSRTNTYLRVIGRLMPGVTISNASAEMTAIARQLELEYPETNAGERTVIIPLRDQHYAYVRPILVLILAGAGLVLLIVCANVANLVLARSQGRRREFAIRTSLGAGRARLARQLVAENIAVALSGGAIGLLAVAIGADAIRAIQSTHLSHVADVKVDLSVAAAMILTSVAIGVIFGLIPLLQLSKSSVRDVLNEDSPVGGSPGRTHRFRAGLVVAQMSIAVALLIGTGLLTRSFVNLVTTPTGFETRSVLTFETAASRSQYPEHEDRVRFFEDLSRSLASLPGVDVVGLNSDMPFSVWNQSTPFNFVDNLLPADEAPMLEYHTVGPEYFRAMGIDLLAGRVFEPADGMNAPSVVVVNEEMVRRYWPGVSPLGRELLLDAEADSPRATVIGIVANVLDDGFAGRLEPQVYIPYMQRSVYRMTVVLRTSVDPISVIGAARRRVLQVDPNAPVGTVQTLRRMVAASVSAERATAQFAVAFSVLSVLLAALGTYGLLAFIVAARRREIGIRAALGAQASDVLRLILRQSSVLMVAGTAGGFILGLLIARLLSSVLFGVSALDPVSFVGAPLVLMLTGLAASYIPARKAMSVQPVEALKIQ
ncbi:MAG: ABC transporter permease [Gemmatimonadota bacterium]|nr:MAG: ABC transporter permease [Gemmatimonadota bacterium]